MRDEVDLGRRRLVHLLQDRSSPLRHDHQPGRAGDQFLHHTMLVGVRLEENGVERGDDRRFQFAQQRQQVAAGRSAEDSELVLDRDDVHVAGVQEVGGAPVRTQILLLNLEANGFRILVASRRCH